MSYDDASARCQVKARCPNEIYELILARPSAVSEVRDDGGREIKNGGQLKRGGLSNARLIVAAVRLRCGRSPVGWEEHPTGGCQSRLHPNNETIHFGNYSKSRILICKRQWPD